ncbi:MAG: ATP-binding protein [Pontimonas sp.]
MRRLLLASFLGIVLVALAISSVPFAFFIQTVERERLLTTLERDAFVIAGKAEEALESLSPSDLRPVRDLAQDYRDAGGARVVVTDEQGIVIVTNDPEENRAGVSYLSRPEFAEATAGQISTGERYSETLGLTLVYVAVPVFSGQSIVGAVRLTFDKAVIDAEVSRQLTGILIVALTTLALGGALALILSRTLARGIRELEHASEAFAGGDFSARAREDVGPSDIRALAGGFNAMAEKVSALVETQRRFASDASHQLRTPLTALMLRIEGLRESVKPTAKVTERFDALEQEIARLNRLIDGLLALGRAGAEKTPVISVDASTLARERVESWRSLAEESGVTLDSHIEDNVTITAAETALEHILDVYIDNALAVSPAGSTITVLLTREGSAVTLLVHDEGPGVSDEVARRAFDRFWRGGSSYEGSGLGLAIVKELADASGASVALESRENGGAQARVVFQT